MMKKIFFSALLFLSISSYAQEDYNAHLKNPNEIGIDIAGVRNDKNLIGLYYERQVNHHIGMGATIGFGDKEYPHYNNGYYYEEYSSSIETFNFNLYGRYYFKDYITQSFLYLLFDHDVKVRYFIEGTTGLASLRDEFTERIIDTNNNFVIQQTEKKFIDATLGIGFGFKLLFYERFSLVMTAGGGSYLLNKESEKSYGSFNFNVGYRF